MLGNTTLGHFQGYHWICMISNAWNDIWCLSLIQRGAWSITAYVSLDLVETQWKCFMNAINYCEPWNRLYKSILLTALESSFVNPINLWTITRNIFFSSNKTESVYLITDTLNISNSNHFINQIISARMSFSCVFSLGRHLYFSTWYWQLTGSSFWTN